MQIASPVNALRLAGFLIFLVASAEALAQANTADIIEQARARARQVEEIKQVLTDPDQNVRLAAFEGMVDSGDPLMREIALDTGLASTDRVLRGLALKHTILGLAQLSITLTVDDSAPKPVQDKSVKYLEKNGNNYILTFDPKGSDLNRGFFHPPGNLHWAGNVSGTVVTFNYGKYTGELILQDDNTLAGLVHYNQGGGHRFKATAPLR